MAVYNRTTCWWCSELMAPHDLTITELVNHISLCTEFMLHECRVFYYNNVLILASSQRLISLRQRVLQNQPRAGEGGSNAASHRVCWEHEPTGGFCCLGVTSTHTAVTLSRPGRWEQCASSTNSSWWYFFIYMQIVINASSDFIQQFLTICSTPKNLQLVWIWWQNIWCTVIQMFFYQYDE